MKGFDIVYKKMKRYFQAIIFQKIVWMFEKLGICIKIPGSLIINSRISNSHIRWKGLAFSTRKRSDIF